MTAYERKLEWIRSLKYLDLFGYASQYGVQPYLYVKHWEGTYGERPLLPIWKGDPEYPTSQDVRGYWMKEYVAADVDRIIVNGVNISNYTIHCPAKKQKDRYSVWGSHIWGTHVVERIVPFDERFLHDADRKTIDFIRNILI